MAKFSASFYLLFAMLVFASVKSMLPKVKGACEKATIGGGCPDVSKCVELCRPCYRGVGIIAVFCRAAGGGIPYDQCKGCELAVRGGGCPDVNACVAICEPCYRGIGKIRAFCRSAGGGIPFDECICSFAKGAPCNPPAPPKCPGPWPPSQNV
ncbi:hypothetical protein Pint_24760 [Pistacia integerrima]|uniref:Uncharacterized protein n=1 Tax=Pistacia integerrima TaxID=434235 RepID=A0ACC0YFR6_9ROSI|nr:hypothetical protein Pint_24760 [Pistacia integerrima]